MAENSFSELPVVVDVSDQPCQQLYEAHPVLLGYDVVQYHFIPSVSEGGVAVRGRPEFAYNFQGYQFWFSTLENRNLFMADPWKYAPAWGGFCSWGIALEHAPQWPWQTNFLGPPASPWEGWAIVNGTLIFNIWQDYTDRFLRTADTNMQLAAERWTQLFGTLRAGPFNTHCIGHGSLKNWCLAQQPAPWLQELPSCTSTTTGGGGGGIVSQESGFENFSNSSLSPFQRRWIITVGVVLPLVLLLIGALLHRKFQRKTRRNVNVRKIPSNEHDNHVTEEGTGGVVSSRESPNHDESTFRDADDSTEMQSGDTE